jgi:hypothetical protein
MSKVKVVRIKDVKGERREPPRTSWILVIVNTGDEVLRFVWIYSPQLPSHRK